MHLPPVPGKKQKAPIARYEDTVRAIDESTLMSMFRSRRRRMEQASRVSKSMVKMVNTLTESTFSAPMTVTLLEGMDKTAAFSNDEKEVIGKNTSREESTVVLSSEHFALSVEAALEHGTSTKARRLHVMRAEQRRAAESNSKPHFQLKESELETTQPPTKFSSTSLMFALEILSKSALKILDATDDIMLKLSTLSRKAGSPILNEIKVIIVHSQHISRCHAIALAHLKQYEVCEKSLNDATAYELGNARERLIEQKGILTAQEQRQKVAEEQLRALRTRLESCEAQCRLWSSFLQEGKKRCSMGIFSVIADTDSASVLQSRANSTRVPVAASHTDDVLLRRQSLVMRSCSLHGGASQVPQTHAVAALGSTSSSLPSLQDDPTTRLDPLELRVAQFWCNPYFIKSAQRTRSNLTSNLIKRESVAQTECNFMGSTSRSHLASRFGSPAGYSDVYHNSVLDSYIASGVQDSDEVNTAEVRLTILLRSLLRGIVRKRRNKCRGLHVRVDEEEYVTEQEGNDVISDTSEYDRRQIAEIVGAKKRTEGDVMGGSVQRRVECRGDVSSMEGSSQLSAWSKSPRNYRGEGFAEEPPVGLCLSAERSVCATDCPVRCSGGETRESCSSIQDTDACSSQNTESEAESLLLSIRRILVYLEGKANALV